VSRTLRVAVVLQAIVLAGCSGGITEVAIQAVRLHMRFIAESIYEYHQQTGRWPKNADDLAHTSFPLKTPVWRGDVEGPSYVILWPDDRMKPDPKDNAQIVLVYHNRGTLAEFGRKWVCWGDLRDEYLPTRVLEDRLKQQRSAPVSRGQLSK
jgi:hypothetical protein